MPYDFELEAKRVIDAIEPTRGAMMTVVCALREAFEAGRMAAQMSPPTGDDGLIARIERHLEDVMSPSVTHRLLGEEASTAFQRVAFPSTPMARLKGALRDDEETDEQFGAAVHALREPASPPTPRRKEEKWESE